MKQSLFYVFLLCTCLTFGQLLYSQDTRQQREEIERLLDQAPEQKGLSLPSDLYPIEWDDEELPADLEHSRMMLFDIGGWLRSTYSSFDTASDTDRSLRDYDLRLWTSFDFSKNHKVYGRGRSFLSDYNKSDSPNGKDENWQRFRVDQLFYEGQFAQSLGFDKSVDLDLTLGRQFFFLGKGAALSNVLDGGRLDIRSGDFSSQLLIARTLKHSADFDPTVPEDRDESDRFFAGLNLQFPMMPGRRAYTYFLAEIDNNNYQQGGQGWDYEAYYAGFGSSGDIAIEALPPQMLAYSAEVMIQFGRSTATGTTHEESISAWGIFTDFFVLPGDLLPFPSRGVVSYYFGSGDQDRTLQLGTVGGNRKGTRDNALNYFGYVNTGYQLAPRLTNLHMIRLNFESTLLEDACRWTQSLKLGVAFYNFFKHHDDGATITDFTSNRGGRYVGFEADIYLDWAVVSDLDIGARYGLFAPGDAYEREDIRNYVSVFATLSF